MTPSDLMHILRQEGLRPPRSLTLAITGACNLTCRHCWVAAGGDSPAAHVPEQTLFRIVADFAALGGESIRFTGGEPFCHPGLHGPHAVCSNMGFRGVSLQTNGMLISDDHVAALRKLDFPGLSIQISLDGATAPTHDLVRGAGAFDGALEGIRRLVNAGLGSRVTIFFTEMRHNLEEIPALLELAVEMGIGAVVTGALVGCGRAADEPFVAPPDPDQYLRLLDRYDNDVLFREQYGKVGTIAALEWRAGGAPRTECCTFVENPYLTSDGRLYPCVLCHADAFSVTRVFEKGLADAFAEGAPRWSTLLQTSRDREALQECEACPGKARCAGGCMGRAWGSCGDLMARDDRCGLRQMIYRRENPNSRNFHYVYILLSYAPIAPLIRTLDQL